VSRIVRMMTKIEIHAFQKFTDRSRDREDPRLGSLNRSPSSQSGLNERSRWKGIAGKPTRVALWWMQKDRFGKSLQRMKKPEST
jgi:hypothetical protein